MGDQTKIWSEDGPETNKDSIYQPDTIKENDIVLIQSYQIVKYVNTAITIFCIIKQ